ncbi:MAG: J domain-containing protein [Vicinamibacterales bacterium]
MSDRPFVDYYEVLQLSPNASDETLERVYRLLAKRYHPDNPTTGDAVRFAELLEAHQVLSDPAGRAAYDVRYDENRGQTWKIFDQATAGDGRAEDQRLFHGILSLLYVARRRDPRAGGLGPMYLEKMLGCPQEHLDFPLWYLRQRGWIETLDTGQMAITVEGIDKLSGQDLSLPADRLIAETSATAEAPVTAGSLRASSETSSRS